MDILIDEAKAHNYLATGKPRAMANQVNCDVLRNFLPGTESKYMGNQDIVVNRCRALDIDNIPVPAV